MAVVTKIVSERFELRPTIQREWRVLITIALFCGGVGGGLFLISQFFGFTFGVVLALIIVGLGMGGAYFADLGRPLRFWRMLTSWSALKTSWIARGIWGIVIFLISGALYIAPSLGWFTWLPWTDQTIAGRVMLGIAVVAAAWVMIYTGFVMAQSPAIALWHTPLLPALFMLYGLTGGIDLTMISLGALGETYAIDVHLLELAQIMLLILCIIFIWMYLGLMSGSRVGAREAVRMMTRGELSFIFWGVVIMVGLVIPLAVTLYVYFIGAPIVITGVTGLLALIGCLFFRYALLRAGSFSPLM
jgi:protein NrfD